MDRRKVREVREEKEKEEENERENPQNLIPVSAKVVYLSIKSESVNTLVLLDKSQS